MLLIVSSPIARRLIPEQSADNGNFGSIPPWSDHRARDHGAFNFRRNLSKYRWLIASPPHRRPASANSLAVQQIVPFGLILVLKNAHGFVSQHGENGGVP